jgi:hypothetical protein
MPHNRALGAAWLTAGLGWIAAWVFWALWMSQPAPDDYVPKFARVPYEPFSRQAAVAVALREWRLFGEKIDNSPVRHSSLTDGESPERREGLWQRVGEYWWIGVGPNFADRAWTGKHDEKGALFAPERDAAYAWSAAFISYVMRISGAGRRFPYSDAHADFINAGHKASPGAGNSVRAMRLEAYAPELGDLICFSREKGKDFRFDDISGAHFHAHCAIVVDLKPGVVSAVSGNLGDAVALTRVPTTEEGKIVGPNGRPVDGRHPWFVVIAVPYDS